MFNLAKSSQSADIHIITRHLLGGSYRKREREREEVRERTRIQGDPVQVASAAAASALQSSGLRCWSPRLMADYIADGVIDIG